MLIENLYSVKKSTLINNKLDSIITINPNHKIFEGHFPNNPVLPGVVQLQIIKELLENELNKTLTLSKGTNIKYTSMVVPNKNNELKITADLQIIDNTIKVNSIIQNNNSIFLKFKGVYTEAN